MSNVKLLEVTLRDGGYVNDFNFDNNTSRSIIKSLQDANIDFVEIGILGKTQDVESTKFNSINDAEKLIEDLDNDQKYVIMANYSDIDKFEFSEAKKIKYIRIAFFKPDCYKALECSELLKDLGFNVFLQAMATHMYTNEELIKFILEVNKVKPYSFSLVDSFSTFYDDDIEKYYNIINNYLDVNIVFGFHGHNGLQLANSNSIKFINLANNRDVIIDSSVYGMGRGAGNASTELLTKYLNEKNLADYDIFKILDIYNNYLQNIYNKSKWGYELKHYISSLNKVNPAYIWYLNNININNTYMINYILKQIPENKKHNLDIELIEKIVKDL